MLNVFQATLIIISFVVIKGNMPQIHRVILKGSVTLQCPWSSEGNKQWYFNDSQLYFNKVCLDRRCDDSILLREDYSLYIGSVEIQLEGEYQCKHESEVITRHKLIVEGRTITVCSPLPFCFIPCTIWGFTPWTESTSVWHCRKWTYADFCDY